MKHILQTIFALLIMAGFVAAQDYVGPEKCLQCHNNMTGWRTSMHANGYSVVLDDQYSMVNSKGIINDYDENLTDDFKDGLDFNTISSAFDPFKPNAPILGYDAVNGYTIQIGDVTSRVYLTYGGSGLYKQRYAIKLLTSEGESEDHYISPIQYNEKTHEYVLYHADDYWVYDSGTPTNVPVFTPSSTKADASTNSRSLTKGCSGCHVTGLVINAQDGNGEWTMSGGAIDPATISTYTDNNIYDLDGDGTEEQLNTGCERCHGPGGDHVAAPSPANIINPANLTSDEANNMCGMCHSRGKSKPNNTFSFPYHDDTMMSWEIGETVEPIYTDGGGYWGDGINSSKHHQQFYDFYKSDKPTFQFHQVTCFECHDVHNEVKHHIREEIEEEDSTGAPITVLTDNDNNTLCLACHATHGDFADISVEMVADYDNNVNAIGAIVSAHTNHPYDPTGTGASRCSKCHNPKTIKSAVPYDIHSHTFEVMAPEKTKNFQMPNSCAVSCHGNANEAGGDFGTNITAADLTAWGDAAQQDLADTLMHYFGPAGIWWQHTVSVDLDDLEIPIDYVLSQNYPNPFNPATFIKFSIPKASNVRMVVYDALGREVAELINSQMNAGNYNLMWNAATKASGIYFYRLEAGNYVETKKMLLVK